MSDSLNRADRPIAFGEVLFDVLPDGTEVLGGAPLNAAWHLRAFGYDPILISRIGSDTRGKRIREIMENWGMDTQGLQVDSVFPTGVVNVSHGELGPDFRIEPDQAYDHISLEDIPASLKTEPFSLILHGTLALRSSNSYQALANLREKLKVPTFADLNLRTPWWNQNLLEEILQNTSWLKVNEEELKTISQTTEDSSQITYPELAKRVIQQYKNIELFLVTLGAEGALTVTKQGEIFQEKNMPIPTTELKDTVGGGDAFTAVAIIGLLEGWNIDVLLQRANTFAGLICRIPGATTTDRTLYENQLKSWAD